MFESCRYVSWARKEIQSWDLHHCDQHREGPAHYLLRTIGSLASEELVVPVVVVPVVVVPVVVVPVRQLALRRRVLIVMFGNIFGNWT